MAFRVTQHNSIRAVAIILSLLLLVVTISPALANPLAISGVSAANITHVFAVVSWVTDQPSDSTVNYGNTTGLGSSKSNSALVTDHKINLISLTPDTLYYYEVISVDTDGISTVDNNAGNYYTFTTPQTSTLTGAVTSVIVATVWVTDKILGTIVHLDDPEPLTPMGSYNASLLAEIAGRLVDTLAWFVGLVVDSVR